MEEVRKRAEELTEKIVNAKQQYESYKKVYSYINNPISIIETNIEEQEIINYAQQMNFREVNGTVGKWMDTYAEKRDIFEEGRTEMMRYFKNQYNEMCRMLAAVIRGRDYWYNQMIANGNELIKLKEENEAMKDD